MKRENEFMGFLSNMFSGVPAAEIEDYRPDDKNTEWEFNVYKTAKHGTPEEMAYLRAIRAAIDESKLKIYANHYINHGSYIVADLKVGDRKIEIYIETEIYKD
jgi:hypothetical protein